MSLRPYQQECLQAVKTNLDAGITRQLVVAATGTGKTAILSNLPASLGIRRMLVLAHRDELLEQAAEKLRHWNPRLRVAIEAGEQRSAASADVVVASVATLGRAGSKRLERFPSDWPEAVVVDECFPPGTLIDGKPIEDVNAGDVVRSFDESTGRVVKRRVLRSFKSPSPPVLVSIRTAAVTLFCTPKHLVFCQRGWCHAINLRPDDHVMYATEMHWMQACSRPLYSAELENFSLSQDRTSLLLRWMPGHGRQAEEFPGSTAHKSTPVFCHLGPNEIEQSDANAGSAGEDERHSQGYESHASRSGWQWEGIDRASATYGGSAEMGNGSGGSHWKAAWNRVSHLLQVGRWKSGDENRGRDRRGFPLQLEKERAGPQERPALSWLRVESVEVYKSGSDAKPGGLQEDGFVYNLEIEDTHTYFANGVLVHNCHHAASASYGNIFDHFSLLRPESRTLLLGVTATPFRSDGEELSRIFERVSFEYGIRQAIEDRWLADVRGLRLKTHARLDRVKQRAGDFATDALAAVVNTPERNAGIVKGWLEHAHGRPTLAFTADIRHAKDLAGEFCRHGVKAEAVWGDDPERADKLARFRARETNVLANCALLTEGFDAPLTSCVIMARPTRSQGLYLQCIGRGTRLDQGKADTLVIDVVDVSSRFTLANVSKAMGLPENLDLKGRSAHRAAKRLEEVAREHPGMDIEGIRDLAQIEAIAERVDLFRVEAVPEIAAHSHLRWHKTSDGYVLWLPDRQAMRIKANLLGHFDCITRGAKFHEAATLARAFEVAERWVQQNERQALAMVSREAKWLEHPATPKQLEVLAKRFGRNLPPNLTKGHASSLIGSLLAQRMPQHNVHPGRS